MRIPTIVEVIRGSRVENCRAAAANGTPASAHSLPISFAASISAAGASPYAYRLRSTGQRVSMPPPYGAALSTPSPVRGGEVEQRVRAAIDQGVPVVGDHRLEVAGLEEAGQQADGSARQAEVPDQAFVAGGDEGRDRSVGGHGPLPRGVLGIVEEDDRQVSEAETLQALGDRRAHPGSGEVAGRHVAVRLGLQDESGRDAAGGAERAADAPLALAAPVVVRGVEVAHDLATEERVGQGGRLGRVDAAVRVVGRAPRGGAGAQARHLDARRPELLVSAMSARRQTSTRGPGSPRPDVAARRAHSRCWFARPPR